MNATEPTANNNGLCLPYAKRWPISEWRFGRSVSVCARAIAISARANIFDNFCQTDADGTIVGSRNGRTKDDDVADAGVTSDQNFGHSSGKMPRGGSACERLGWDGNKWEISHSPTSTSSVPSARGARTAQSFILHPRCATELKMHH